MKLAMVIHSIRISCITVLSFNVKLDGNTRIKWSHMKEVDNHLTIALKLLLMVREEKYDTRFPGSKNPNPLSFVLNQLFCRVLILLDKCIAPTKVLGFILMAIASIHQCVKFFKVDILVLNNIMPYGTWNWIDEWLELHEVDSFLQSIGLLQFPCSLQVGVIECMFREGGNVWSCSED